MKAEIGHAAQIFARRAHHINSVGSRSERKAICSPSGEKAGCVRRPVESAVRFVGFFPPTRCEKYRNFPCVRRDKQKFSRRARARKIFCSGLIGQLHVLRFAPIERLGSDLPKEKKPNAGADQSQKQNADGGNRIIFCASLRPLRVVCVERAASERWRRIDFAFDALQIGA